MGSLRRINSKGFKDFHQKRLDEKNFIANQKLQEEKRILKEQKRQEEINEIAERFRYNWKEELLREFGTWAPIDSDGPTNSSSTTFGYFIGGSPAINYDTGERITFTYNGLNGIENYPTSITIDQGSGEVHTTDPPPFSQVGVQGYTAKLNPRYKEAQEKYKAELTEWEAKKDANFQSIKDTLKSFGTSWEEMRASNKWVKKLSDGTVVAIVPTSSNPSPMDWTNNVRVIKMKQCSNASGPMTINYNPPNEYQDWVVENAEVQSEVYLEIGQPPKPPMEQEYLMPRRTDYKDVNPLLDLGQEYAERVGADYMMGARVQDAPEQPSFFDYDPSKMGGELAQVAGPPITDPNNPEYNKQFAPITAADELSILGLDVAWRTVTNLYPDLGWTQQLAIDYARGNLRPRNVSPSPMFNAGVLRAIEYNLGKGSRGSVSEYPGDLPSEIQTASTRLVMGRFNYKVTANGIQVTDFFDFDQNKSLGFFGNIPGLNQTAERIIDLGQRRAAERGYKMVHTMTNLKTGNKVTVPIKPGSQYSPTGYGIPINFTIPWNQVSPQLRNKLDPNQRIVPIVKRNRRGRVVESTWDKLKKHRKTV